MANIQVSQAVKVQYENLPYPHRKAEDEVHNFIGVSIECPDQLNHICFGGKRDFTKKIRVLIAGGGTGDVTVQWSVALRNNADAEIIYLDFSEASRKIAEARLEKRGLSHKVRFITDSILNIPKLGLGKFDVIDCSGVLHHLEEPEKGLKCLADCLSDEGAMVLMLYAKYGRTGVYAIQEIMRYINVNASNLDEKIADTKSILSNITNASSFFSGLAIISKYEDNAEIYDLFLHSQDRAYSVKEVYDFAATAGLELLAFGQNEQCPTMDSYLPEKYIPNNSLLEKIKTLPINQQHSIAEVLNGNISKHCFYLSKTHVKKPELTLDVIPSFSMCISEDAAAQLAAVIAQGSNIINAQFGNAKLTFVNTPHLAKITQLIDGTSTLRDIFSKVMRQSKMKPCNLQTLLEEFRPVYNLLENHYLLFLRQKHVPSYENFATYQKENFGQTTNN